MKTLLIIILLTFAGILGYSQSPNITDVLTKLTDLAADQQDQIVYLNNKLNALKKQIITPEDLFDYQQECYNDSLYNESMFKFDKYMHDFFERLGYKSKDYIWYHKIPTFEGFIEYMKKKYKTKTNNP